MKSCSMDLLRLLARPFGAKAESLVYFRGGHAWSDGILYEFGQNGLTCILKVMELPAAEAAGRLPAVIARLQFAAYLGDHDVPIIRPLISADGDLLSTAADGEHIFIAYCYRKDGGKLIYEWPEENHGRLFGLWGEAMGKMHAAAKCYPHWYRLGPEHDQDGLPGWESELNSFHSWCKDEEVKAAWLGLKDELQALPVDREGYGFTHNDLHLDNMLAQENLLTVIDFDVATPHWFACDMAIALYSIFTYASQGQAECPPLDAAAPKRLFGLFLQGYEKANRLDAYWLERLELFLRYRRMLLFTVFSEDLARSNPGQYSEWKNRIVGNAPFPDYL